MADTVIFCIPLISKKLAVSWEGVVDNLNNTIRSIMGQSNGNFEVAICHNEKPEIDFWSDSRVKSIPAEFPGNTDLMQSNTDKRDKLRHIASMYRDGGERYFMLLDADDLVHRRLCEYVLTDDNRRGYAITKGFSLDASDGRLYQIDSKFEQYCASCFIGYFKTADLPTDHADLEARFSIILSTKHRSWHQKASQLGQPVDPVDFYSVVYLVGHDTSLRGMKTNFEKREFPGQIEVLDRSATLKEFAVPF